MGDEQEKAINDVVEVLKTLDEQALGDNKFFNGEVLGLVDLAFGWLTLWFECVQEAVGVRVLDPIKFPRLNAWMGDFRLIPVINENLPDREKMILRFKHLREQLVLQQ